MSPREIFAYYSREDVQKLLLKVSEKREVAGVFKDGGFSSRPNSLVYAQDIIAQIKSGAVAFHGSLERWSNPMSIGGEGYEKGRIGWDLILDIDVENTEHGKVTLLVFIDALKKHGIRNCSVKFTGGTGFHLGVPWECFPRQVDYSRTEELYPGLARNIVQYLREFVRDGLEKALLKKWPAEQLAEQCGKPLGSIMTRDGIDPFQVANVDPILISPRHLFRLPWSLHEKSHLVSMPLAHQDIMDFKREDASPEKLNPKIGFLDRFETEEASMLVMEAADWSARHKMIKEKAARKEMQFTGAVPLELAPPCIKNILSGLSDGRKRSLFVLINFLSSLRWNWDSAEDLLLKWNEKNKPPLADSYIRGQVRWHRNRQKPLPPPNCSSEGYYPAMGVCIPDDICGGKAKTIKNPINYSMRKARKREDLERTKRPKERKGARSQ